MKIFKKMEP